MSDPIGGVAAIQAAIQLRINDLDLVANQDINLSMNLAGDTPSATFKMTLQQLIDFIPPKSYPGFILQTFSTSTPNELGYVGTWVMLPPDLSIRSGALPVTVPAGSNTPAVPLLEHSHGNTASASSTFTGAALPNHDHGALMGGAGDVAIYPGATSSMGSGSATQTSAFEFISDSSAGTPTGTVSTTVTMTNALSGVAAPTLDVKGSHVVAVSWHRTA